MTKEQSVEIMTDKMAKFVAYVGKKLPDDVEAKLQELRQQETTPLATAIYDTMARNQAQRRQGYAHRFLGHRTR